MGLFRRFKEYSLVSKITRLFDLNWPATFCQKVWNSDVLEMIAPLLDVSVTADTLGMGWIPYYLP
jgi:hypothetical protein